MSVQPVTIDRFGGLDLRDDPQEVQGSAAIDMLNVDIDHLGRIRSRSGIFQFSVDAAAAYTFLSAFRHGTAASNYLLGFRESGGTLNLDKINSGGTITNVGSWAVGSVAQGPVSSVVEIGTPTTTTVYVATGAQVRKFDGTSLSTGAGNPGYVAVTPTDNRLVQGNYSAAGNSPTGANGSPSTVFFSDAGDPDTYSANNFVSLHPGDGEQITGIFSWANYVFVFKETKLFVFYGTSTDSSGEPVFNYRLVTGLRGNLTSASGCVVAAAAPEGLYFVTSRGVFLTTGGPPQAVSDAIDPVFQPSDQVTSAIYQGPLYGNTPKMTYADGRLFLSFGFDVDNTLVYDTLRREWLLWSMSAAMFVPFNFGGSATLVYTQGSGAVGTAVGYLAPDVATDFSEAMASRYRTGFLDLGTAGSEKRVREWLLDGSGSVSVATAVNDTAALGADATVTLGTAPAVGQGRDRRAVRGRNFSVNVSADSGAWSLSRLTGNVANQRPAGPGSA